jgi:hypothetical protein
MRWKAKKATVRNQLAARPIDKEEDRTEWQQDLAMIPDFDVSLLDSQSKLDKYLQSRELSLNSSPDEK